MPDDTKAPVAPPVDPAADPIDPDTGLSVSQLGDTTPKSAAPQQSQPVAQHAPTISAAPAPSPVRGDIDRIWNAIKEGIPAFNDKFEAAAHTDTGTLATGETPKMQLV